jgi:hypothetical protein
MNGIPGLGGGPRDARGGKAVLTMVCIDMSSATLVIDALLPTQTDDRCLDHFCLLHLVKFVGFDLLFLSLRSRSRRLAAALALVSGCLSGFEHPHSSCLCCGRLKILERLHRRLQHTVLGAEKTTVMSTQKQKRQPLAQLDGLRSGLLSTST